MTRQQRRAQATHATPTKRTRQLIAAAAIVAVGGGALAVQAATTSDSARSPSATSAPVNQLTKPTAANTRPQGHLPRGVPANSNIYSQTANVRIDIRDDAARVYVPSGRANQISAIDPTTHRVVWTRSMGGNATPQHIVPSYDLKTLWVLNNTGNTLVPINAHTGEVGKPIAVDDPYNLYFTPDGRSAIVVAERNRRLDFRDPHTMKLQESLAVPGCRGINHADYSIDFTYMLFTCEFSGGIAKINVTSRRVVGLLPLRSPTGPTRTTEVNRDGTTTASMPQDVRLSPDGKRFYVADMLQAGVHVIDGERLQEIGFIHTGIGAHGITPNRDGTRLYVANRGSTHTSAGPRGPGSVSVIDTRTDRVVATWPVPNGGSPDMGNMSADGTQLWLSGRFDSEIYEFDIRTGTLMARIGVPAGPHGLTIWPLAGRFSLGHTGNMR